MSGQTKRAQPRASWRQKYKTWMPFQSQCVWCGDSFRFFAPLDRKTGAPIGKLTHCSRRCVSEARWEGQKKAPNATRLRHMYEIQLMSIPAIAKQLGCVNSVIWQALKRYGIPAREHTSVRSCKKCGAPVQKIFHSRRAKDGTRILCGTLCLEHRREYFRDWSRRKRRKVDPLVGTRKTGRKSVPTYCSKCGLLCESARRAVVCCNQRWNKISEYNEQRHAGQQAAA